MSTGAVGHVSWPPEGSSIHFGTPLVRDIRYGDGSISRNWQIGVYTITPSGFDLKRAPA